MKYLLILSTIISSTLLMGCDKEALQKAAEEAARQGREQADSQKKEPAKQAPPQDQAGVIPGRELTEAVVEQNFFCYNGDAKYNFVTKRDGSLIVSERKTNRRYAGTYTINNGKIKFTVQEANYEAESGPVEVALGLIVAFQLPGLKCFAVGHTLGKLVEGYLRCPSIKYIPNVGFQKNAFEFHGTGMVKWRQWDELTGANDTLYSEAYGIYYIDGGRIYMAFGDPGEGHDKYLTGSTDGQTMLVDQLEPERGACKPN